LSPNGWMHQDATWYGGRPRPRRLCVRWGPSFPSPKGAQSPNFRPMSIVTKRWDGLRWHLVWRLASAQATLCSVGTQLSPEQGTPTTAQFLAHVHCGQTAGWMKTPLDTVDLGSGHIVLDGGHIVLDGVPVLCETGTAALLSFRPMSIVATVAHLSYC